MSPTTTNRTNFIAKLHAWRQVTSLTCEIIKVVIVICVSAAICSSLTYFPYLSQVNSLMSQQVVIVLSLIPVRSFYISVLVSYTFHQMVVVSEMLDLFDLSVRSQQTCRYYLEWNQQNILLLLNISYCKQFRIHISHLLHSRSHHVTMLLKTICFVVFNSYFYSYCKNI